MTFILLALVPLTSSTNQPLIKILGVSKKLFLLYFFAFFAAKEPKERKKKIGTISGSILSQGLRDSICFSFCRLYDLLLDSLQNFDSNSFQLI